MRLCTHPVMLSVAGKCPCTWPATSKTSIKLQRIGQATNVRHLLLNSSVTFDLALLE